MFYVLLARGPPNGWPLRPSAVPAAALSTPGLPTGGQPRPARLPVDTRTSAESVSQLNVLIVLIVLAEREKHATPREIVEDFSREAQFRARLTMILAAKRNSARDCRRL